MRHISKKESNHGSIRSERYSQEKGLGLAWVEYRKIALLIDRIRDAPIPGMHRLIKFRSTRAEIIGAARFPTRPVQPVGREGGECPITPEFGVLQGGGDRHAHPQQLGARLVHSIIFAYCRVSVWEAAQPPTTREERIQSAAL
jgi:hypothetical protein